MSTISQIPITSINVLNPRSRNKRLFESIIANIGTLGLKKPITVTPRADATTDKLYDLVCGQGRLEAYQALGYETIPAIIIETDRHDAYLMSLVENIARRHHTPVELLKEIITLKQAGLSQEQIAAKLALDRTYVYTAMHLLEHGELTLLKEVERGRIPVSVAMKISTAADQDLQAALREAYTSGELRGAQLLATKRYLARQKKLPHAPSKKSAAKGQPTARTARARASHRPQPHQVPILKQWLQPQRPLRAWLQCGERMTSLVDKSQPIARIQTMEDIVDREMLGGAVRLQTERLQKSASEKSDFGVGRWAKVDNLPRRERIEEWMQKQGFPVLMIGKLHVPRGDYSLFTIPTEKDGLWWSTRPPSSGAQLVRCAIGSSSYSFA